MFSEHLCGICSLDCCPDSCICCESCQTRTHYSCLNFDPAVISALKTELVYEQYFCSSCSMEDGVFKYHESLARLEKSKTYEILEKIAKMENLMVPQREFRPMEGVLASILAQDEYVNGILEKYNYWPYKSLSTTKNGNGLFNSASLIICGSEKMATELRVRTCIMMVLKRHKIFCGDNLQLCDISDTYEASCLQCAKDNTLSNAFTMAALSMATKFYIHSCYPPVNSILEKRYMLLLRDFYPENDRPVGEMNMFWSGFFNRKNSYVVDHFVPIVREDGSPPSPLSQKAMDIYYTNPSLSCL